MKLYNKINDLPKYALKQNPYLDSGYAYGEEALTQAKKLIQLGFKVFVVKEGLFNVYLIEGKD